MAGPGFLGEGELSATDGIRALADGDRLAQLWYKQNQ